MDGLITFVTPRIAIIPMPEDDEVVVTYINSTHGGHYKVFNLLIAEEKDEIDPSLFNKLELIDNYPINPNNIPSFESILKFCLIVDLYLQLHPHNIVILCASRDGGRSHMLAALYLLHSGSVDDTDESITTVTASTAGDYNMLYPSQLRYIYYYESLLRKEFNIMYTMCVTYIRITSVPNFDSSILSSGCSPYVIASVYKGIGTDWTSWKACCIYHQLEGMDKNHKIRHYSKNDKYVEFDFTSMTSKPLYVRGDTVLGFYTGDEKMFQISFNTAFVESNYLSYDKQVVDIAHLDLMDQTFSADFKVEIFLHRVEDRPDINSSPNDVFLGVHANLDYTFFDED